MQHPTEVELKVLRAVRDHIKRHNISPTYDELAGPVGRDRSTVRYTIKRLIAKGLLSVAPGRYRNLFLTEAGLVAAKNGRRRRK